jgi:hypothetical protein
MLYHVTTDHNPSQRSIGDHDRGIASDNGPGPGPGPGPGESARARYRYSRLKGQGVVSCDVIGQSASGAVELLSSSQTCTTCRLGERVEANVVSSVCNW